MRAKGLLATILRPLRDGLGRLRYRADLRRGRAAGGLRYGWLEWPSPPCALVELRLPAAIKRDEAARWCEHQTLRELRAVGIETDGRVAWTVAAPPDLTDADAAWFSAPGALPDVLPTHLETSLLIAAAEDIDAVVLRERVPPPLEPTGLEIDVLVVPDLRRHALYRSSAFGWDPASDEVVATTDRRLLKLIDTAGVGAIPDDAAHFSERRRGPYLSSVRLPAQLEVGVRDASQIGRRPATDDRPSVLILTSFLARGGAEHTLIETLRLLRHRFDFTIATLAPHRPELDDRRADFRDITERIFCLGDVVHPAAMEGMIAALLDATGAEVLYNHNGTTLFYELAPRLRQRRPDLHIIDTLYDHEIGYIDRYDPSLCLAVDTVVAVNRRIVDTLEADHGWPRERVRMILPCGRPAGDFPAAEDRSSVRTRLRSELGLAADDVVFLTAARMHSQKRPLDLVALAARVRDERSIVFLVVGGGELDGQMDAVVAASDARIIRLPFRSDIPDLVAAADVGCLVSDYEGLPVFLLECLQLGRPFLGTDVGDMGELLRSTGAGIVVGSPGDLDALEAGVRRLADAVQRSAYAAHAAAVSRDFDPAASADAFAEVFAGSRR